MLQILEYPGFTPKQNFEAWKLRSEIIDSYIEQGRISMQDLEDLSKTTDDYSRTKLLLSILNKTGKTI